jgi:hypothetical protein
MKLRNFLPQNEIIFSVARNIKSKYPEKGSCAYVARDLTKELKNRGIFAKHVVGNFHLDEPASYLFISPKDTENDEYTIEHDWVEVEGNIIDPSATQFKKYVNINIPDIVNINYTHPLFRKYQFIRYV